MKLLALLLPMLMVAMVGCKPAAYEIVRDEAPQADTPQNFGPGDTGDNGDPTPDRPLASPTARVEVIKDNQSVIKVRVGEPVTIRPGVDTVDPDDVGVSSCANPGIVKADYQLPAEAPSKDRGDTCDTLEVPYTFNTPGDVVITMTVTDNEGETAQASMTLTVIPADGSDSDTDGGLTIRAYPMTPSPNQDITLVADCDTVGNHTVTWDFGDGNTAEGDRVVHRYPDIGSRQIKASCTNDAGRTIDSSITIVVVADPQPIPGAPTTPPAITEPTPDDGGGDDDNDDRPGQTPDQQRPQQGQRCQQQADCSTVVWW